MTGEDYSRERMIALAKDLLTGTTEGKIAWTATDDETTFLYSRPNWSVTICSMVDRDGDNQTKLSVHNSRGTVVRILENRFRQKAKGGYEPGEWNELLDGLFIAARGSALAVDDILDDILADLRADLDDSGGGPSATPPRPGPGGFPGPLAR
jgi:hypothetical protein